MEARDNICAKFRMFQVVSNKVSLAQQIRKMS